MLDELRDYQDIVLVDYQDSKHTNNYKFLCLNIANDIYIYDCLGGGFISYRDLLLQQQDNFQLLKNSMQLQRLEDARLRQCERLYSERQIINDRKANYNYRRK